MFIYINKGLLANTLHIYKFIFKKNYGQFILLINTLKIHFHQNRVVAASTSKRLIYSIKLHICVIF